METIIFKKISNFFYLLFEGGKGAFRGFLELTYPKPILKEDRTRSRDALFVQEIITFPRSCPQLSFHCYNIQFW